MKTSISSCAREIMSCGFTERSVLSSVALAATLSVFLALPNVAAACTSGWYLAGADYPNSDRYGVYGYNYVYNNPVITGQGISEALGVWFPDWDWFAIGWYKDQSGGSAHFYADWCLNNLPGGCLDYGFIDLGVATYGTSHSYKVSTSSITTKTYTAYLDGVAKKQVTFSYSYSKPSARSESHNTCNSLTGHYWNLMHQIYIPQTGLQWYYWDAISTFQNPPYYVTVISNREFYTGGQGS